MPSFYEATYKQIPWVEWPTDDPTILGKRLVKDKPTTVPHRCRRLSCNNCGPVLATLRARNLLYKLTTEGQETLWWGEIDVTTLRAIQRYAHRHPEEKRLTSIYFDDPELRTVLATSNMAPRRTGVLREIPKDEAVINYWYKYAVNLRLRKNPHDDWDIASYKWSDWVDDGPKDDIIEADQRMDRIYDYVPGTVIDDPDTYKRRFRRIRDEITNPPASGYLDN